MATDYGAIKRKISALAAKHEVEFTIVPALSNPHMPGSKGMCHYQVALAGDEGTIDAFYSCGDAYPIEWAIKHHSGSRVLKEERYQAKHSVDYANALAAAKAAYRPTLIDVLPCLAVEADVLNYTSFEDWATSVGYDTDSRKAENIYRICCEHATELKRMFGTDFDKLCELAAQL